MKEAHWYRAFGSVPSEVTMAIDEFRYEEVQTVKLYYDKHPVLRETPQGVWLWDRHERKERWVGRNFKKRWACPTKEEALKSLKRRNRTHIDILSEQLAKATAIREALGNPDTPIWDFPCDGHFDQPRRAAVWKT